MKIFTCATKFCDKRDLADLSTMTYKDFQGCNEIINSTAISEKWLIFINKANEMFTYQDKFATLHIDLGAANVVIEGISNLNYMSYENRQTTKNIDPDLLEPIGCLLLTIRNFQRGY